MTTANPSQLSINAFLQIFATKMPNFRAENVLFTNFSAIYLYLYLFVFNFLAKRLYFKNTAVSE